MIAARGDVKLQVGDEEYTLALTLGAVAEMEESVDVQSFEELAQRLRGNPSMVVLVKVLTALLRAGGHDVTDAEVRAMPLDIEEASAAIGQVFSKIGAKEAAPGKAPSRPLKPTGRAGSS